MYRFLYNCVFCLAFINFLIYWINLFFSEGQASRVFLSPSPKRIQNQQWSPLQSLETQTNKKINNNYDSSSACASLTIAQTATNETMGWNPIQEKSINYTESKNTLFFFSNWFAKQWNNIQSNNLSISFITCSLLWFVLTLLIFFRISQSNHFPLANFYEALIFLTWCLVTLNFIILLEPTEKTEPINLTQSKKNILVLVPFLQRGDKPMTFFYEKQSVQKQVSGAILAPCILLNFIIAFAQFHLSADITPLVPALKSNWLLMHVSIMICSYTTFIIGGLLSLILLMQTIFSSNIKKKNKKPEVALPENQLRNKDQLLSLDYPWFKKNTYLEEKKKLGEPSVFGLSYLNNQVKSKNRFLKMQNQSDFLEKSEDSFQPSLFNRLNKKSRNTLEDTLTYQGFKSYNFSKPINNLESNHITDTLWQQNIESNCGFPSFESTLEGPSKMQKKNFYIILDNLSYRMMGIGFPLFTLGILSGAVWANEAWGSYWSWDIKEVGSFINWLLVALYFHCRYKNFISLSHIVAFISLIILFFNFFGISLGIFGSSLHAYGASS